MDLGDLPFDMPKLRRRLRQTESSNAPEELPQPSQPGNVMIPIPGLSTADSSESQASSSHSVREEAKMNLSKYRASLLWVATIKEEGIQRLCRLRESPLSLLNAAPHGTLAA